MGAADPTVASLALAAAGGLAGSFHCLGMCGAFPLALSSGAPRRRVSRQLLYQLGRVNALVFIGAISGALGAAVLAGSSTILATRILSVFAGAVMLSLGFEMLGWTGGLTSRLAFAVSGAIARPLQSVIRSPSPVAPLALGVANAFLPCHLVYAFAAQAAATATPVAGMLTMLAFGAGTVPALLGLGLFGGSMSARTRGRFDRVVALALLVYGVILFGRAFSAGPGHVH